MSICYRIFYCFREVKYNKLRMIKWFMINHIKIKSPVSFFLKTRIYRLLDPNYNFWCVKLPKPWQKTSKAIAWEIINFSLVATVAENRQMYTITWVELCLSWTLKGGWENRGLAGYKSGGISVNPTLVIFKVDLERHWYLPESCSFMKKKTVCPIAM